MVAERKPRANAYVDYLSRPAACGHPGICGCSVASCCTGCPLEKCRYDGGPTLKQLQAEQRRAAIVSALQRGASVNLIAEALGVSRRTVFRAQEVVIRRVSNVTSATMR